jgi:hypothetical protein
MLHDLRVCLWELLIRCQPTGDIRKFFACAECVIVWWCMIGSCGDSDSHDSFCFCLWRPAAIRTVAFLNTFTLLSWLQRQQYFLVLFCFCCLLLLLLIVVLIGIVLSSFVLFLLYWHTYSFYAQLSTIQPSTVQTHTQFAVCKSFISGFSLIYCWYALAVCILFICIMYSPPAYILYFIVSSLSMLCTLLWDLPPHGMRRTYTPSCS